MVITRGRESGLGFLGTRVGRDSRGMLAA